MRYDHPKRFMDIVMSAALLVIASPALLAVSLIIRLTQGRPILFCQKRPGLNEERFTLLKFRTMRNVDEEAGFITDQERLTRIGRLLRATSLDELPSLVNVVRGDMSLVGPRPLLIDYLDRYTPAQRRRHSVRPGVTGLAQVRGRNSISWERKFAYDLYYVRKRSFWLDLKILWETVTTVARRTGISADGEATMPEFLGSSCRHSDTL